MNVGNKIIMIGTLAALLLDASVAQAKPEREEFKGERKYSTTINNKSHNQKHSVVRDDVRSQRHESRSNHRRHDYDRDRHYGHGHNYHGGDRYYGHPPRYFGYWPDYHRQGYQHRIYRDRHYYYNNVGFYFPGYGMIKHGHHHDRHCPHWHFDALLTGVALSLIINH
jgi:hypothetical protein